MPTIQAPDGSSIEFPDEMPTEQIAKIMQAKYGRLPVGTAEQPGKFESFLRGAGQGATANLADEAVGYLGNLPTLATDGKDAYLKAADADTQAYRANNEAAHKANPWTYLAGELTGAVVPFLLPQAALTKLGLSAGKAAEATTIGQRIATGAKTGAVYGGVYGAGAGDSNSGASWEDAALRRAKSAGVGAATGAVVGGALPPIVEGTGSVIRGVTAPFRARLDPEKWAGEKVGEAFYRDAANQPKKVMDLSDTPMSFGPFTAKGVERQSAAEMADPGQLGRAVATAQLPEKLQSAVSIEPNTVAADIGGDNVRSLARSYMNRPNEMREPVTNFLDARQANQFRSVQNGLMELGNPKDYHQALEDILSQRSSDAKGAYDKAFQAMHDKWLGPNADPAAVEKLGEVINRPYMQKIVKRTADKMEGVSGQDLTNLDAGEIAHRVKMQIDKEINHYDRGTIQPGDTWDKNDLLHLKRDFIGVMPPEYKAAMDQYAGHSAMRNALEEGYNGVKTLAPEEITKTLSGLSKSEQEMWRLGAARKLDEINMGGNRYIDRTTRDYSSPDISERLKRVFETPEQAQQFADRINTLFRQAETRRAVQGNSTTAKQLLEAQEGTKAAEPIQQAANLGSHLADKNWMGALKWAGDRANRLATVTPQVAEQGLKMLFAGPRGSGEIPAALARGISRAQKAEIARRELARQMAFAQSSITAPLFVPSERPQAAR